MGGTSGFWLAGPEGKRFQAKIPDEIMSLHPLVPQPYIILRASDLYSVPGDPCLKRLSL